MKITSTAVTILAVAMQAEAFAPMQNGRGAISVAVQSSLTDAFSLGNIESEVSVTHGGHFILVCVCVLKV